MNFKSDTFEKNDYKDKSMEKKLSLSAQPSQLELMCARFYYLFESYKIPLAEIPTVLPPNTLRRSDLLNNATLVDALSPGVVATISGFFEVSIEWLKGLSDDVVPSRGKWYKNTNGVANRIASATHAGYRVNVMFITELRSQLPAESLLMDDRSDVLIGVVLERIKDVDGISIKSYDVLDYDQWNRSSSQEYLKYLAAFCKRTYVNMVGLSLPQEAFLNLFSRKVLPVEAIESKPYQQWRPTRWDLDGVLESYSREDAEGTSNLSFIEKAVLHPHTVKDIHAFERGNYTDAFAREPELIQPEQTA